MFWGYILGAALMIGAGIVQAVIGIEAAQKNLEDVAKPLSAEAAEGAEDEQRPTADARAHDERRPAAQPPGRARSAALRPQRVGHVVVADPAELVAACPTRTPTTRWPPWSARCGRAASSAATNWAGA